MAIKSNKKETINIENAREKIESALKTYFKKHGAVEREKLFKPGMDSLGLTKEQLKDKSSDSTHTRYKALTGSIINELIKAGSIILLDQQPIVKAKSDVVKQQDPIAESKKKIRDYLISKYLTDDEQKDKNDKSKMNLLKSIISDKINYQIIAEGTFEDACAVIETKFKKYAKVGDAANAQSVGVQNKLYPTTLIGNCLRNQYEKYNKITKKSMSQEEYDKELSRTVVEAINILGGTFLEKLSLNLVKSIYGSRVVDGTDKLIGGADDHGIDAEICLKDEVGFEDKIVIQAKTKKDDEAQIGEKIIREFVGSMILAGAKKGILITNAVIHKDARNFCRKSDEAGRLVFIDKNDLIKLMTKYNVGIKQDTHGNNMIDDGIFLLE